MDVTDVFSRVILSWRHANGQGQNRTADTRIFPATTHLPENTSDAGMDLILVELKGGAAKPAKGD